jgi:hypothetical protein
MASSDTIPSMFRSRTTKIIIAIVGMVMLSILAYQIPAVNSRLSWRIDVALTYFRGVVQPVEAIPVAGKRTRDQTQVHVQIEMRDRHHAKSGLRFDRPPL